MTTYRLATRKTCCRIFDNAILHKSFQKQTVWTGRKTNVFIHSYRCRTLGNKPIGVAGFTVWSQFLISRLIIFNFPFFPLCGRTLEPWVRFISDSAEDIISNQTSIWLFRSFYSFSIFLLSGFGFHQSWKERKTLRYLAFSGLRYGGHRSLFVTNTTFCQYTSIQFLVHSQSVIFFQGISISINCDPT